MLCLCRNAASDLAEGNGTVHACIQPGTVEELGRPPDLPAHRHVEDVLDVLTISAAFSAGNPSHPVVLCVVQAHGGMTNDSIVHPPKRGMKLTYFCG